MDSKENDTTPRGSTRREPIKFGIYVSARGNTGSNIAVDDVAEAAMQCVYYLDSLLIILSLADAGRLEKIDPASLSVTMESY